MASMPDFEMPEPPRAQPVPAEAADLADGDRDDEQAAAAHAPQRAALGALWRRLRVPALAFSTGVLVAVAAVVGVGAVRDGTDRADVSDAVADYVALVASDGIRAEPEPSVDDVVASTALLDVVAVAAHPAVVCDAPRIGDAVASVGCRVRVDGSVEPATLLLEQQDLAWVVTRGLEVPVRIQSGALLVDAIGGVPVDDAVARGERAVWLLPGRYDVDVRTPPQLAVDRVDGLVVSTTGGSVRWTPGASPTIDADVRAAALAYVEACAAAPTDGCPALQERDPAEQFDAFAVTGHPGGDDDPHVLAYDVSIRRPADEPREYVVITVRVDFGDDLDRYDVAVAAP